MHAPPILPGHLSWRLLEDWDGEATWNMEVDEAMLEAVAAGLAPPTLRFYGWECPAISVGRFQDVERGVDVQACRELGIPLVRRPTGGRGVLHGGDETVSIAMPLAALGARGSRVADSYAAVSAGFIRAFALLGRKAALGRCERRAGPAGDCFAVRSQADLMGADGVKLVGSAQCRRAGALLQQTSIPHRPPRVPRDRLFHGRSGETTYPLCQFDPLRLRDALRRGFQEALGIRLHAGSMTAWELERAAALRASYCQTLVDRRTGL